MIAITVKWEYGYIYIYISVDLSNAFYYENK